MDTHAHCKAIHNGSMQILEKTGVRLEDASIIRLLAKHGVRIEGKIAYFTEEQVWHWVQKAPASFKVYARNPMHNMVIGGAGYNYAPGYGAPAIMDFDGHKRPAVFEDYITFLKLVHQCALFHCNGGILVQPTDLAPDEAFLHMFYEALTHTDKCLIGGAGGREECRQVLDMLSIVFGGREELREKPRILGLISTSSPLAISQKSLETMQAFADYGQPLIITPGPMAGMTGPVTIPGHLVLANCEALAGIIITQMLREGTPVIYGVQGSNAHMRTACSCAGSPDSVLIVSYCGKLARYYGLPSRSGGIKNDAKAVDVQSGYESMMMLMTSVQSGINFILHSAGILDTFAAMSYEKFMVDTEIMAMVAHVHKGLDLSNEAYLALDAIQQVGSGGEFLTSDHTMDHFRHAHFEGEVGIQGQLSPGETPRQRLLHNIAAKKSSLLDSYVMPDLPAEIKRALSAYIDTRLCYKLG